MSLKSIRKDTTSVPLATLVVYSVLFYSAWALVELLITPQLDAMSSEALAAFLRDCVIKNIIWTFPAFILIYKYNDQLTVGFKEMFTFNKGCIKYLSLFLLFTVFIFLNLFIHSGKIAISEDFGADEIIVVAFVGLTEEIVFRGWLLNATAKRNENVALAINAVMFLAIHFPIWIHEGVFISNFANFGFISIMMLSVIFGYVFLKTKNILLPIALHMYWDFLLFLFS